MNTKEHDQGCDAGYACEGVEPEIEKETTPLGQYLLRRQAAADSYVKSSTPITAWSDRTAFFAGWNKAIEEIGLMLQTPGGDGCFCAHHPDDPAHTKDCYDVIDYLLLERGQQWQTKKNS